MYFLYSCFLFFAIILYTPVYYVKNLLKKKKALNFNARFGLGIQGKQLPHPSIWFHAVSVGEVLCLRRLVQELKQRHPDWSIYCSTLTETGQKTAVDNLKSVDQFIYVPVDLGWVVKRFFKILQPSLFAVVETEIWPHLLRGAKRNTNGVLMVNGRVSSASARKYSKVRWFIRCVLKNVDCFLMQTEEDSQRLSCLGVESDRMKIIGNLKSDIILPEMDGSERATLRKELSLEQDIKVFIAGSTHPEEDTRLLQVYKKASSLNKSLFLILAPRHPHRAEEVSRVCRDLSLGCVRRSLMPAAGKWDVMILDTIGELTRFYDFSDCAYVGGSLVPKGGQNLLEPAFYAKPIFFGPHMENFAELADRFVQSKAARIVRDDEEIIEMFLLKDWNALLEMGKKAQKELQGLQGATDKTIQEIETFMKRIS